jgi:serine protease Do
MKIFKKAAIAVAVAASVTAATLFGGCFATESSSSVIVQGKDGQDVSIYDIYEAAKTETSRSDLTFDEFLKEYLSYDDTTLAQATSEQTIMNQSLLSSVSIVSTFTEETVVYSPFGSTVRPSVASYAGSGVIISVDKDAGDMYVVTNCHVVYDASAVGDKYCDDIALYFYGGESLDSCKMTAEIVGATKNYDIAVLKVTGSDIVKNSNATAAEWVTDEEVYVGETVYAVGNPKAEYMSVTKGIISRDTEYITIDIGTTSSPDSYSYRVLRTDTAINGGNSGGGLFNAEGKIIGIVNAKSVSSDIDNMGYALPAATTRRVVQNILDNYDGTESHGLTRAYLGVTTTIVTSTARYNTEKNVTEILETVGISSIESSSKFYGKIHLDDIITKVTVKDGDGKVVEDIEVNRYHNITDAMLSVRAGYTVTLTINRSGTVTELSQVYSASDLTTDK